LKYADVCPYEALTKVGERMTGSEVIGEVERGERNPGLKNI
jgi:hypothetical protein